MDKLFSSGGGLSKFDADRIITSLKPIPIEKVGSAEWMKQRQNIEQLNMQAHQNVMMNHDEFIKEELNVQDKVKVLIHELIVIEIWKAKVAPLIWSEMVQTSAKKSLKPYLLHYQEAVITNLLELIMFHDDVLVTLIDDRGNDGQLFLVELIDYCARKIMTLNTMEKKPYKQKTIQELSKETEEEGLLAQKEEIEFKSCMAALSIFRYITNSASKLPPSLISRITETHDFLLNLVYLVDHAPWLRKSEDKKKTYKYINGVWTPIPREEYFKITPNEAQVWLALNDLAVDPEIRQNYEINNLRKDTLQRLKRHLNDTLIDQIPPLIDLQRVIEEIGLADVQGTLSKSILLIEQVPEIREKILEETDFEALAAKQAETILVEDEDAKREEYLRIANMLSSMAEYINDNDENININLK